MTSKLTKRPLFSLLFVCLCFLFLSFSVHSVHAEDTRPAPGISYTETFDPPCEFQVSFPETPDMAERCGKNSTDCRRLYRYVHVEKLQSSIDFRVTCAKAPENAWRLYDRDLMYSVLRSESAKDIRLSGDSDLHFRETGGFRIASLNTTGHDGQAPVLYTAQIWLGPESIMTIKASLSGRADPVNDSLFAEILRSAGPRP